MPISTVRLYVLSLSVSMEMATWCPLRNCITAVTQSKWNLFTKEAFLCCLSPLFTVILPARRGAPKKTHSASPLDSSFFCSEITSIICHLPSQKSVLSHFGHLKCFITYGNYPKRDSIFQKRILVVCKKEEDIKSDDTLGKFPFQAIWNERELLGVTQKAHRSLKRGCSRMPKLPKTT